MKDCPECGMPWEKDNDVCGCWNCGYEIETKTEEEEMSKPMLKKYIREDGTVEGVTVETYFAPITEVQFDLEDEFIRMFLDTDVTDTEARLSIQDLRTLIDEFERLKARQGDE